MGANAFGEKEQGGERKFKKAEAKKWRKFLGLLILSLYTLENFQPASIKKSTLGGRCTKNVLKLKSTKIGSLVVSVKVPLQELELDKFSEIEEIFGLIHDVN